MLVSQVVHSGERACGFAWTLKGTPNSDIESTTGVRPHGQNRESPRFAKTLAGELGMWAFPSNVLARRHDA